MLAERWDVTSTDAFQVLRAHARAHRLKLREVAGSVIERTLRLEANVDDPTGRSS
jgi:AmiR/NasT family two-component response regulator